MNIRPRHLLLFVQLSRPVFLIGGFLLYGLGASVAAYLGRPIDAGLYIQGQALITSMQLMTHYLNEFYDAEIDVENPHRTPFSGGSGAIGEGRLPRRVAWYAAVVAMGFGGSLTSLMVVTGNIPPLAWAIFLLIFLGAFFYSTPPLRLIHSGYGELTASLVVAGLVPAAAFVLQTGELHRLLFMTTAPLIALHFAMVIAFEVPDFGTDVRYNKRTLMIRLGWERTMRIHDAAILFAILAFVVAALLGLPRRVALGGLIALPLALAAIWQMDRIRRGGKPRYTLLTTSAVGLFALAAYLMLAGFLLS